jgi:uncharacterized protein YaiL (DUF2058 family)
LHSSAEERKRRTAVDAENWVDDSDYRRGVRPVSLKQLVEERKLELQQAIAATSLEALAEEHHARLHKLLDEELRNPTESDIDDVDGSREEEAEASGADPAVALE